MLKDAVAYLKLSIDLVMRFATTLAASSSARPCETILLLLISLTGFKAGFLGETLPNSGKSKTLNDCSRL